MDKEINNIIMQEIGLGVGDNHKIYDQDTGFELAIGGSSLVEPGYYGGRNTIEFDPHNNRKMMVQMFEYFLRKHSSETDIDTLAYYNVSPAATDAANGEYIECRMSDDSFIKSRSYKRDSLKYTDIIMQLNGESVPLDQYDTPVVKPTIKRGRGANSNGRNNSNSKTTKNS